MLEHMAVDEKRKEEDRNQVEQWIRERLLSGHPGLILTAACHSSLPTLQPASGNATSRVDVLLVASYI